MVLAPNTGSVAEYIYLKTDSITLTISGLIPDMVNNARIDVQNRSWQTVGSPDFEEKFQPAVVALSFADLANTLGTLGVDANVTKIGEFSISTGADSNVDAAGRYYNMLADRAIKALGRGRSSYFKANG